MSTRRTAQIHPDTLPVLIIATTLTAGLAAVSFALSYSALVRIASWAAVTPGLAWAIPVMLDAAILVYTLAVLVKRARRERAAGAWASLALWTAVSVAANAAHAAGVPGAWERAIGTVVAGLAPVAVFLAVHTIADLIVAPVTDEDDAVRAAASAELDEHQVDDVVDGSTDTVPDEVPDVVPGADAEAPDGDVYVDDHGARTAASAGLDEDLVGDVGGEPDTDTDTDTDADDADDADATPELRPVSTPAGRPSVVRVHRPRQPRVRVSDWTDDIVRLHREGLTVREIADRVAPGKSAIADYLRTLDSAVA